MANRTTSSAPVAGIALVAAAGAALLANVAGIRFSDPPLGSHCSCNSGVCPLDANGRRCSCGCALKVDAQPVRSLDSLLGTACTDGMAGSYPCNEVDLMAFLPHADIGGGSGNDVWGWTDALTGRGTSVL